MPYPIDGTLVCDRKKYAECFYLHKAFALLSVQPDLFICGESPDFNIEFDGKRIGVEVTYFHSSAKGTDGRSRRAVEEDWNHLQSQIMKAVNKFPELKGIYGSLEFRGLVVPIRGKHEQFVKELLSLSLRIIASESLEASPDKNDYPLLNCYLKNLKLERVGCYLTWEWNHTAAFVGCTEEELIDMVAPKTVKTDYYLARGKTDKLWLLAVSEHRLSQTIPPFMLDKLNSFETLNKNLQESGFARAFLYQYSLDVVYEWPGWRKHGEETIISTIDELKNRENGESQDNE